MRRFINGKWTSRRAWGDSRRALSSYVRVWDENDKSVGGVLPLYDMRWYLTTDKFKFYDFVTVKVLNRKQNLDVYVTYLRNGKKIAEPMIVFDGSIPNDEAKFEYTGEMPDSVVISVEDDDGIPVGEVQLEAYAKKQDPGAH